VINLPKHEKRLEGVKASLNAAGVPFKRMDAVMGKALSVEERKACVSFLGRLLMTPGMIGCFLSHVKCWKECVAQSEPLIVFEDDVVVSPDFCDKLNAAMEHLPDDWDVLLLGAVGAVSPKYYHINFMHALLAGGLRWPRWHAEDVHEPMRPFGTHAYLVSARGAAKLLQKCPKVNYHVDVVAWGLRSLRLYAIHPLLAKQTHEDTTIGGLSDRSWCPQFIIDPYTGADFAWAWNAPLIKIGGEKGVLATSGRATAVALLGFAISATTKSMTALRITLGYIASMYLTVRALLTFNGRDWFKKQQLNPSESTKRAAV